MFPRLLFVSVVGALHLSLWERCTASLRRQNQFANLAHAGCAVAEQQRRDPHTSRAQRARGRCPIVHLFTSGGLYLPSLGGATLMTHAKFEVIAKLISGAAAFFGEERGKPRWTNPVCTMDSGDFAY